MRSIGRAITGLELPAVEKISEEQAEEPFQILIATLLSARTQDATTHAASTRLFARARTPRAMASLPVREIERLIYPVGFYRNKARHVKACCAMLVERFAGRVPPTLEELVTLPGVGRLQEPPEHLRRHPRAPHCQPARLGAHGAPRRD